MKKGQEPLRSFSDLLQYYEVQRTDVPATPALPVVVEAKPTAPPEPNAAPEATQESRTETTANE